MRPIISPTSSRALNWRSSLLAERQGYSDRLASPTDDLILFVESIITIRLSSSPTYLLVLFLPGEGTTGQFVSVDFILILARSCIFLVLTHIFTVTSILMLG
ncbi:hypothetical protein AALP_AA4G080300 [Arabis alpina]|uniref:Uncharacterized protein n=1 Tax=Arabis alpina TaxID=50452 RepID=A0A087H1W5_ARAAL|nr:hypothetical protein AALP_AA4G080300 [Arabis alpina]